ncbi:MAG TPA: type II secretion system protein GspN [Polyangiaceae bacterium]|nr:type II secretion system protein GspN [Polyangiaceae bacterium]
MTLPPLTPRMRTILRIAGYAAFYVVALITFAYLTFPYERLKDRIVQEFNSRQTGADALRLELDSMSSYWLGGVEAEGIRLISPPKPASGGTAPAKPSTLAIESAHARVGLFSLLFGGLDLSFGADAFGGEISGFTSGDETKRKIELELDDLDLAEAPLLATLVGLPLSGKLSGNLDLVLPESKVSKADGTVELEIEELAVGDGKAKIRDTIALPRVEAGTLVLKGDASQGQLKLTDFSAKGPDLEIVSDGSIRLRDPVHTSFLSLGLRFRFTERYANKNETTRALFGAKGSSMPGLFDLDPKNKRAKREDGFYAWRITGVLSNPSFTPGGPASPPGR